MYQLFDSAHNDIHFAAIISQTVNDIFTLSQSLVPHS